MRTIRKLKIVSDNKVRANRANAKLSTGPKTLSGKEKVKTPDKNLECKICNDYEHNLIIEGAH